MSVKTVTVMDFQVVVLVSEVQKVLLSRCSLSVGTEPVRFQDRDSYNI